MDRAVLVPARLTVHIVWGREARCRRAWPIRRRPMACLPRPAGGAPLLAAAQRRPPAVRRAEFIAVQPGPTRTGFRQRRSCWVCPDKDNAHIVLGSRCAADQLSGVGMTRESSVAPTGSDAAE